MFGIHERSELFQETLILQQVFSALSMRVKSSRLGSNKRMIWDDFIIICNGDGFKRESMRVPEVMMYRWEWAFSEDEMEMRDGVLKSKRKRIHLGSATHRRANSPYRKLLRGWEEHELY
jgi:hypothetical protein